MERQLQKEYMTVAGEASAETEEKRSRFIATVRPVSCEEEAASFINGLRAKYWDATHNVYAYYICGDSTLQKYSDDGEPSGTAGLPVLEAVRRHNVQDVAVVVTRYFGGTLLGAAGLVRAYGKCASLGIEAAGIINRRLCIKTGVTVEYELYGKARNTAVALGYATDSVTYGQDVEMLLYIPVDEYEGFEAQLTEATSGRVLIAAGEKTYVNIR